MTTIILILAAVLAIVLVIAAVISYRELSLIRRQHQRTNAMLHDQLWLKYHAMEAQRQMIQIFCESAPIK